MPATDQDVAQLLLSTPGLSIRLRAAVMNLYHTSANPDDFADKLQGLEIPKDLKFQLAQAKQETSRLTPAPSHEGPGLLERTTDWVKSHQPQIGAGALALGTGLIPGLNAATLPIAAGMLGAAGAGAGAVSERLTGVNPEPLSVPATAGMMAKEGALQAAVPAAIGALGKPAGRATRALYQSSLKPSLAKKQVEQAAEKTATGLAHQLPISERGKAGLETASEALESKIGQLINAVPGTPISKNKIVREVNDLAHEWIRLDKPQADIDAITEVARNLHENPSIPDFMSARRAQDLKRSAHEILRGKYGELSTASYEAQKAKALGLRTAIEQAMPTGAEKQSLIGANVELGKLLELHPDLSRAVAREANRSPLSIATLLSATLAGTGFGAHGGAVEGGAAAAAAAAFVKLVESGATRSQIAIWLQQGAPAVARGARVAGAAGAAALTPNHRPGP